MLLVLVDIFCCNVIVRTSLRLMLAVIITVHSRKCNTDFYEWIDIDVGTGVVRGSVLQTFIQLR